MQKGYEIPAGQVVMFSCGEYSDYGVECTARLLKPLNESAWDEMCKESTTPPDYDPKGDPRFDEEKAVAWLIQNGYLEEIDVVELHLGDYGQTPEWRNA